MTFNNSHWYALNGKWPINVIESQYINLKYNFVLGILKFNVTYYEKII